MAKKASSIKIGDQILNGLKSDPTVLRHSDAVIFLFNEHYIVLFPNTDSIKIVSPQAIRSAFSEITTDSYWLTPSIQRFGIHKSKEFIVSFSPPSLQTLIHQNASDNHSIHVPIPGLVMFSYENTCYLCAIAEENFSPEAIIYAPPLPNVSSRTGIICFGSNVIDVQLKTISNIWSLFWNSPFNYHDVSDKSKTYPHNIWDLLNQLDHDKATKYPLEDLVPCIPTTVDDWVSQLLRIL